MTTTKLGFKNDSNIREEGSLQGYRKRREWFFLSNGELSQIETLAKICNCNKSEALRALFSIINFNNLGEFLKKFGDKSK